MADVSVALDRVGQMIRDQGDANGSRKYFDEALRIDRALHKRSMTRRDWQENLVFSLSRIGDLDRQLGRQRDALVLYEEALVLQRRLAAIRPSSRRKRAWRRSCKRSATSSAACASLRRRPTRIARSWRSAAGCWSATPAT